MLLLHKDISANVTNNSGYTALMSAVALKKEEVLCELVEHQCVSLDVGDLEGDQRFGNLLSIVQEARKRRAEASRVSKEQSEKVQLLVQQNEEKEKTLREENLRKLEEMRLENEEKVTKLKEENERKLAMLMEDNSDKEKKMKEENTEQEALMLARHEEEEKAAMKEEVEKAARKEAELEAKKNVPSAPSLPSLPDGLEPVVERYTPSAPSKFQVPECPVCLEEMVPPTRIFQCRNGHLICETCKSGLNPCICPKCRGEIIGRATDMEAFLRSLQ